MYFATSNVLSYKTTMFCSIHRLIESILIDVQRCSFKTFYMRPPEINFPLNLIFAYTEICIMTCTVWNIIS